MTWCSNYFSSSSWSNSNPLPRPSHSFCSAFQVSAFPKLLHLELKHVLAMATSSTKAKINVSILVASMDDLEELADVFTAAYFTEPIFHLTFTA
jgi:hypothetical protein